MAITNVGELKSAVADWINREDMTNVLPDLITQADNRILTDARSGIIPLDEEVTRLVQGTGQLSPYTFDEGVPTSLIVGDDVIQICTWETYWTARKESQLGKLWTYYEGKIWYTGWPDRDDGPSTAADPIRIRVKTSLKEPLDVTADVNTNAMLTRHPELYLFATLTEAATYLRDMEGLTLYQARYDGLFNEIKKGYTRRKIGNGIIVSSVGGDFNFDRSY